MFGPFMAFFGIFLLLAAAGLWFSRRALKQASMPRAWVPAKPSESAVSPQAAAFLTAATGMSFVLLSALGR